MPVSKSLKPPRISKAKVRTPRPRNARAARGGHPFEALAVLAAAALLSASAILWFHWQQVTLYFGDAEAHLNTARRIIDSRTPGLDQLGTPWLPLPHLAMLPSAGNDELWQTGLAGGIPAGIAFVIACGFFYAAVRRIFDSRPAGVAGVALLALNPNLLYMQSIPMTEAFFLAAASALLYFTVIFRQSQSKLAILGSALASIAASLTRYEGWIMAPVVAVYFLFASRKDRLLNASLFALLAALAPLSWFAHNWWHYGDALAFYWGQHSAKAIQGDARYPGDGSWQLAWLYFRSAAALCAGPVLGYLAFAGVFGAALRRVVWPVVFLAIPALFYIVNVQAGDSPIFVPHLPPKSYYNTRYGLAALPLLAFLGAAITGGSPLRFRPWVAVLTIAAGILPWVVSPSKENWICWKESQVNSVARRAWTSKAAAYLKQRYRPGTGILTSSGDLMGIYREAGIPFRELLHDGNNPMFLATIARPDLHLREEWVVATSGDPVSTAMVKLWRTGPHYEYVEMIAVKGAPVIEIYRRNPKLLVP